MSGVLTVIEYLTTTGPTSSPLILNDSVHVFQSPTENNNGNESLPGSYHAPGASSVALSAVHGLINDVEALAEDLHLVIHYLHLLI